MIKVSESEIKHIEKQHPRITNQIWDFENAELPPCPVCGSTDTASIQVGVIGRTLYLAIATTKFKLYPNGNGKGIYFCNTCQVQFGPKKRTYIR